MAKDITDSLTEPQKKVWQRLLNRLAHSEAKGLTVLNFLQQLMTEPGGFFYIVTFVSLIRQKESDSRTQDERIILDVIYSPESEKLFSPYVRQYDEDVCKNAFGEFEPVYTQPTRNSFDALAGAFYTQTNEVLFAILSDLQGAYRDAVFNNPAYMKAHWDAMIANLPLLSKDVLEAIGPVPLELRSNNLCPGLNPRDSSTHFSTELCMHFMKENKPFIDNCVRVALAALRNAIMFDSFEAIYRSIYIIQLELVIIRTQIVSNNDELFAAAKKVYDLISLQHNLAQKSTTLYPAMGRLLLGYASRNMAAAIDYLAHSGIKKDDFFIRFPDFEQVPFWGYVFSDRLARARICVELLKIACQHVELPNETAVAQSGGYKAEMRRVRLSVLNFFSPGVGNRYEAEGLKDSYSLELAYAQEKQRKYESTYRHCGQALEFAGRSPSCK